MSDTIISAFAILIGSTLDPVVSPGGLRDETQSKVSGIPAVSGSAASDALTPSLGLVQPIGMRLSLFALSGVLKYSPLPIAL